MADTGRVVSYQAEQMFENVTESIRWCPYYLTPGIQYQGIFFVMALFKRVLVQSICA